MPNPGVKINHTDLPNLTEQKITIRSLIDGSEKRGIVKAYDAGSGLVRVNTIDGRTHFWASAINKSTEQVFMSHG